MIKECIKEVIFEEGILSSIISEVMKGTSAPLVESRQPTYQQPQVDYEAHERAAKEKRRKMLDSIGRDSYPGVNLAALGVDTRLWSKIAKG